VGDQVEEGFGVREGTVCEVNDRLGFRGQREQNEWKEGQDWVASCGDVRKDGGDAWLAPHIESNRSSPQG